MTNRSTTLLAGLLATLIPLAATAAPKPLTLSSAGIGKLAAGFTGGLAELRTALPGLDIREAVIKGDDNVTSPGYEVRSGSKLRFTLISQGGSIYLDSKPGLATDQHLAIGSTFEQLAAVKPGLTCQGFDVFKITVACRWKGEAVVYVFDDLKDKPRAGAELDAQLARHKIGHIRWVAKGELAVPNVK